MSMVEQGTAAKAVPFYRFFGQGRSDDGSSVRKSKEL